METQWLRLLGLRLLKRCMPGGPCTFPNLRFFIPMCYSILTAPILCLNHNHTTGPTQSLLLKDASKTLCYILWKRFISGKNKHSTGLVTPLHMLQSQLQPPIENFWVLLLPSTCIAPQATTQRTCLLYCCYMYQPFQNKLIQGSIKVQTTSFFYTCCTA